MNIASNCTLDDNDDEIFYDGEADDEIFYQIENQVNLF